MVAVLGPLRAVHGFRRQLPVQQTCCPGPSSEAKPSLRPRSCPSACTAWPPRSRRAAGAHPAVGQVREARVADHVARVARDHEAAGVSLLVRDSCVERLFVSASSLITWCAPPSRSRKTLALWLPSSRSSGPLSGAALLLDTCSLLQPAQFFVKKRSSEKSEVLVTVSVLEAKSCGAETVSELVTSPQTTLPVDTPPLVAVKVQSRLSQSSGPVEAAPVMVSGAGERPGGCEARRRRA